MPAPRPFTCIKCGNASKATARSARSDYRCDDCYRAYARISARAYRKVHGWQRPTPEQEARRYQQDRADPMKHQRWKARSKARRAIRGGKLQRQPCEVCGAERVEAHHDDYSQPLNVRWLCPTHHREHHVSERARLAA